MNTLQTLYELSFSFPIATLVNAFTPNPKYGWNSVLARTAELERWMVDTYEPKPPTPRSREGMFYRVVVRDGREYRRYEDGSIVVVGRTDRSVRSSDYSGPYRYPNV